MSKRLITRACAAAALLAASPALAQDNNASTAIPADPANTADPLANAADPLAGNAADPLAADPLAADPMATTTTDPLATEPMVDTAQEDDDDGGFPWGVLGLLGLVGLLGMNRRDDRGDRVDTPRDGA